MVKTLIKSTTLRESIAKRTRRIKLKKEFLRKKKCKNIKRLNIEEKESSILFDFNYLKKERILFLLPEIGDSLNDFRNMEELEFSENKISLESKVRNYNKNDRFLALISLKDIIEKIKEQNESLYIPPDFFSATVSLLDYYLIKSKKFLKKDEVFAALFACSDLIDKQESIYIFNDPYFQSKFTYNITKEILKVVNLKIYPVKVYDYFDIFYFQMTQIKDDFKFLEFLESFKNNFMELICYMLFHDESKNEKPSINFISCLLLSYESTVNILKREENILIYYINIYKYTFIYEDTKYFTFKNMIRDSICTYNNTIQNIINKINEKK